MNQRKQRAQSMMEKPNFASQVDHGSLDKKTPAECVGIRVDGNNKWITLIQNASLN